MGKRIGLTALTVVLLFTTYCDAQLFRRFRAANSNQQSAFAYPSNCQSNFVQAQPQFQRQPFQQNQQLQQLQARQFQVQQFPRQTAQRFVLVSPAQYQALLRQQQIQNQLANRPLVQRPQYLNQPQTTEPTVADSKIPTIPGQVVTQRSILESPSESGALVTTPVVDENVMPASANIPLDAEVDQLNDANPAPGPAIIPDGPSITPDSNIEPNPFEPSVEKLKSILEDPSGGK